MPCVIALSTKRVRRTAYGYYLRCKTGLDISRGSGMTVKKHSRGTEFPYETLLYTRDSIQDQISNMKDTATGTTKTDCLRGYSAMSFARCRDFKVVLFLCWIRWNHRVRKRWKR